MAVAVALPVLVNDSEYGQCRGAEQFRENPRSGRQRGHAARTNGVEELGGSARPFGAGFEEVLYGIDQGAEGDSAVDFFGGESEGGMGGVGPLVYVGEA